MTNWYFDEEFDFESSLLVSRNSDASRDRYEMEARRCEAGRYKSKGLWFRYLRMFKPEFRPSILMSLKSNIRKELFLSLAGDLWNAPEIPYFPCDFLLDCIADYSIADFLLLMTPSERHCFKLLPDSISVFRSHSQDNLRNISWTTDEAWALEHKCRLGYSSICKGKINKANCVACFSRRREFELIIPLDRLSFVEIY